VAAAQEVRRTDYERTTQGQIFRSCEPDTADYGPRLNLSDGGYFENSGLESFVPIAARIRRYASNRPDLLPHGIAIKIIVVFARDDFADRWWHQTGQLSQSSPSELLAPIEVLLNTRRARTRAVHSRLHLYDEAFLKEGTPHFKNEIIASTNQTELRFEHRNLYNVMLDGSKFLLPLGWHLSKSALSSIESARSLETIRSIRLIKNDLMGRAEGHTASAQVGPARQDVLKEPYRLDMTVLTPEQERSLEPKEEFSECAAYCPAMVVAPAGEFVMGSPDDEPHRNAGEVQVRVAVPHRFAVGKFAVTFDEWDACVANGGCNGYRPSDQGWGRGNRPVISVSWDEAKAYVAWLSRLTGKRYRLFSEAEREYVTRAGTKTPFWWGPWITPKQANYDGSAGLHAGGSKGQQRRKTVPVHNFEPNPWGLYNVHGNVWEWTEDCWNESNDGNPGDGNARTSGDCDHRVLRGGSWSSGPQLLRSAYRRREYSNPDYRDSAFGFRVARTLDR
jgi:formylglycine-generating enzyme required for sulfatase activity